MVFFPQALSHPGDKPSILHLQKVHHMQSLLWKFDLISPSRSAKILNIEHFGCIMEGFLLRPLAPLRYVFHFVPTESPSGTESQEKISTRNSKPSWNYINLFFGGFCSIQRTLKNLGKEKHFWRFCWSDFVKNWHTVSSRYAVKDYRRKI